MIRSTSFLVKALHVATGNTLVIEFLKDIVVVLTEPIAEAGALLLRSAFREVRLAGDTDETELCRIVSDAQAIVTRITRITRKIIESAAHLKVIVRHGVGVDNIDLEAATEHGVQVFSTPEGLTVSVAEFTIGAILALLRRTSAADAAVRSGNWHARYSELVGEELYGKTVGIVGLGRIGTEVARRLRPFGVEMLYYDLVRRVKIEKEVPIGFVSLDNLLRTSDVVSLHVPATKETFHMIGKQQLEIMKSGAILLNLARGTVVDEEAVFQALSTRRLAGAALDVFEQEPLPPDSPLVRLPNVLLSPHMSGHTREALDRTAMDVAKVLKAVFSGKRAPYLANPEVLKKTEA
mgnify:CR=1 FL=1